MEAPNPTTLRDTSCIQTIEKHESASTALRDANCVRTFEKQDPHSQFPSLHGRSQRKPKGTVDVPHVSPELFFRKVPTGMESAVMPKCTVALRSGRSIELSSAGPPQQGFTAINGPSTRTRSKFKEAHSAQNSGDVNATHQETNAPPLAVLDKLPADDTAKNNKHNFATPPPPTKQQPRPKRGSEPRRLVMLRPMPTPAYFGQILQGQHRLQQPRPLLIVLDLNGVLVHRRKGSRIGHVPRPDLHNFLEYLFSNHHVMVWSSGMPENVTPICKSVFSPEQFEALIGIWARDTLRLPANLFRENIQVYKQLSWIWESEVLKAKAAQSTALCNGSVGTYDQSNTVLIDDSVEKAIAEPFNLLQVNEFVGKSETGKGEKGVLAQVASYLEELKWASDVSAYMNQHPFSTAFNK